MIQKSLSPVAKSRISSFCGNTMSVEKRTLAWTGTMSCCEYLIVRPPPVSACSGNAAKTARQRIVRLRLFLRTDFNFLMLIMLFLLDCVSCRTAKGTFKAKRGIPERPEGEQEAVRHKDQKETGEIAAWHDHRQ